MSKIIFKFEEPNKNENRYHVSHNIMYPVTPLICGGTSFKLKPPEELQDILDKADKAWCVKIKKCLNL